MTQKCQTRPVQGRVRCDLLGRPSHLNHINVVGGRHATIKGFEVMRALRKGQAKAWCIQPGIRGEVRLIERAFGIGPSALSEAMELINQHFAQAA